MAGYSGKDNEEGWRRIVCRAVTGGEVVEGRPDEDESEKHCWSSLSRFHPVN